MHKSPLSICYSFSPFTFFFLGGGGVEEELYVKFKDMLIMDQN